MSARPGYAEPRHAVVSRSPALLPIMRVVSAGLALAGALDLLGLHLLGLWPVGLLVALNVAAVFTAWRLVLALGAADTWHRVLLVLGVLTLATILLTILVLGSLGWLSLGAVTLA